MTRAAHKPKRPDISRCIEAGEHLHYADHSEKACLEEWARQQPETPAELETEVETPETQEDSESSSQPTELSWAARAADIALDVRTRPLTDPEALELAKVYALLAIHEQLSAQTLPAGLTAALTHTIPGA